MASSKSPGTGLLGSLNTAMPEYSEGLKISGLLKSKSRVTRQRLFPLTDLYQMPVRGRAQALSRHRGRIETPGLEQPQTSPADIFIQLEFYPATPVRLKSMTLSRLISAPKARQAYMSASSKPGIFRQNLGNSHAAGQPVQNERYPNPMTLDARLAKADVGINADPA